MSRPLNVDIDGRVQKIISNNPLLPLFEAVVNSIQAIEEYQLASSTNNKGAITVEIVRSSAQGSLGIKDNSIPPVTGYIITDDGIGFNDDNIDSFCTSDSKHKRLEGGKGVGRFAWLKFFKNVTVDSVFLEHNQKYRRAFGFNLSGIDNDTKTAAASSQRKTTVTLSSLLDKYQDKCPKGLEVIADKLVEHLLSYFATSACPSITVKDSNGTINLQDRYTELFGSNSTKHQLTLKGYAFSIIGLRLYQGNQVHKLHLCASKRAAESLALSKFESMLGRKVEDNDGQSFAYWVFIESPYLDKIVNEDREGLRFPDENDDTDDFERPIKRPELVHAVIPEILSDLSKELEQVRQANKERVDGYIQGKAPEYRFIAKQFPEKIALINRTTDKDIDSELRKLQFDVESKARDEAHDLLEGSTEPTDAPSSELEQRTSQLLCTVNDIGKASLSKYIIQRRVILNILKKRMELDGQKYPLEKAIHELIFPLGQTSDDVEYEKQNLWIIDERLSYHSYLGSDKALSATPAETSSTKEPDLIIFNRPIALDNQNDPSRAFECIEIVEFKRPGRDDYTDAEHPVLQVMKYIEDIKDGTVKNRKGRPIELSSSTHFYCYVMCDITEKLRKILSRMGFLETPDGQGLFHYAKNHNAYIEVMSYNKMLRQAEQRNRILFDKLHIK